MLCFSNIRMCHALFWCHENASVFVSVSSECVMLQEQVSKLQKEKDEISKRCATIEQKAATLVCR